jgi:hypothetical protein
VKLQRTRARLERAEVHHREFGRIWHDFLTGGETVEVDESRVLEAAAIEHEPYVSQVTVYPDGEGVIEVEAVDFPGDELALELGEFLYQLRAALDSLIYETAIHVSGQDPPPNAENLEFPIRRSKAGFDNAADKIAPLAEHHRVWIEDMQPYHTKYETEGLELTANALDAINDLARKDRHRGLRVVASWGANKNPQLDLPAGCSLEWLHVTDDGLLERESEVARFKIRNWTPGLQMQANPNFTIDVTVEDAQPPADDEDTFFFRSRAWYAVVKLLIEGFERSLDGDPGTMTRMG